MEVGTTVSRRALLSDSFKNFTFNVSKIDLAIEDGDGIEKERERERERERESKSERERAVWSLLFYNLLCPCPIALVHNIMLMSGSLYLNCILAATSAVCMIFIKLCGSDQDSRHWLSRLGICLFLG